MSIVVTILGTPVLWPTQGDTNYSNGTTQFVQLVEAALNPIAGLYNGNTGNVGAIQLSDSDTLTYTVNGGPPIAIGGVTSVGLSSSTLSVSGSPITSSGTITADLSTTAVTPGSYTYSSFTVDSYGRITAASSGAPPVATTPGGSNTQIQYNNAGSFGGASALTWDGTTFGVAAPLTMTGSGSNLTLADSSNITGNLTTFATRPNIQTNVTNGNTFIDILPNGTAFRSGVILRNNSDKANSAGLLLGTSSTNTSHILYGITTGTGTALPLNLGVSNGTDAIRIDTDGTTNILKTANVLGNGTSTPGIFYVKNSDNSNVVRIQGADSTDTNVNGGEIRLYNRDESLLMMNISTNTPWTPLDSGICGAMIEGFTAAGTPAWALYSGDGDPTAIAGNGQLTLWEKSGTLQACNIQNNAAEFFGLDTTIPASPVLNGRDVWLEGGSQTEASRVYLRGPSLNGQLVLRGSVDASGDTTVSITTETVNANAVNLAINTANNGEVQINADTVIVGDISATNLSGTNTGDQTLNSLLPTQTGNEGKFLITDGTDASWSSPYCPYYVPAATTFTVPLYSQVLYSMPITNDGTIVVDGYLIGV